MTCLTVAVKDLTRLYSKDPPGGKWTEATSCAARPCEIFLNSFIQHNQIVSSFWTEAVVTN